MLRHSSLLSPGSCSCSQSAARTSPQPSSAAVILRSHNCLFPDGCNLWQPLCPPVMAANSACLGITGIHPTPCKACDGTVKGRYSRCGVHGACNPVRTFSRCTLPLDSRCCCILLAPPFPLPRCTFSSVSLSPFHLLFLFAAAATAGTILVSPFLNTNSSASPPPPARCCLHCHPIAVQPLLPASSPLSLSISLPPPLPRAHDPA